MLRGHGLATFPGSGENRSSISFTTAMRTAILQWSISSGIGFLVPIVPLSPDEVLGMWSPRRPLTSFVSWTSPGGRARVQAVFGFSSRPIRRYWNWREYWNWRSMRWRRTCLHGAAAACRAWELPTPCATMRLPLRLSDRGSSAGGFRSLAASRMAGIRRRFAAR